MIENGSENNFYTLTLYQMEMERVKYSIARYLRTRLVKIEKNLNYIVETPDALEKLSPQEQQFATELNNRINRHFEAILSRIDSEQAREHAMENGDRLKNDTPNTKVFFCCKKKQGYELISKLFLAYFFFFCSNLLFVDFFNLSGLFQA